MKDSVDFILLCISAVAIIITMIAIAVTQKKKSQLKTTFNIMFFCVLTWVLAMIAKILMKDTTIDPFFFEQLTAVGICYTPVFFLAMTVIFTKTKIKIKWYHWLLFVVPTITFVLFLTNDFHHLFLEKYSSSVDEIIGGPYYNIHIIYTYLLYFIGMYNLINYSIKNSGFFSKQLTLILIGTIIPVIINVLGGRRIISISTYATPISFAFGMIFYALAIFKFKFMGSMPIALQKIVDRISDSYIVLDEDNVITDFNKTFLTTFNLTENNVRNKKLFDVIAPFENFGIKKVLLKDTIYSVRNKTDTVQMQIEVKAIKKFFNMEINSIKSKEQYIGTLILLKDTTQHIEDLKKLQENQEILIERERLATLGQMIGGISHNLKTPIMSISGASEGLSDLITEYEQSIEDPEVTIEDHHDIAKDMREWVEKIRSYTEYMSDVITAVKGQAVNLSEQETDTFTVEEIAKRVNILMKHELKSAIVYLETKIECKSNETIFGNINSLVQVINNMISNSVQAYNGEENQKIELTIKKPNKHTMVITVRDYGPGIPEIVKEKLFKEMITTKGKNGTGLGLYMSYSNIKAHFNGNIEIDNAIKDGTAFNIIIPV